jgi:predicted CoA-binding protein
MADIRDGLNTNMRYAVVSSLADFGEPALQHGDDRSFWGMRKPPFEAYKIVEVMRSWGTTVYAVGNVEEVAGQPCYPSLLDLPEPVDCAILSLPHALALTWLEQVLAAQIPTVWLQWSAGRADVRLAYETRGVRVVSGCVLLHWDVQHVSGLDKGRHICNMHGNLERAARIRVDEQGVAQRIEPTPPQTLPLTRETVGTRLLLPFWPKPHTDPLTKIQDTDSTEHTDQREVGRL